MSSGFRARAFLLAAPLIALSCATEPAVYERTDFAMGTVAQLKVVARGRADAESALERAFAELRSIEARTTSYSDTSDVARVNRAAGGETVPVSAVTDAVLETATAVAEQSGGAFDPTTGALVELWGFPDSVAVPDSAQLAAAVTLTDWRGLRRDGSGWRLERAGMAIDLGGVAKGFGVDRAADVLAGATGACLVNVGGDLAVRGRRADGEGWLIGVQDPRDPSELFLRLRLAGAVAVATSGDYQRFAEIDGVRYHHILDPDTGRPARGLRSVTVIAPTCALADAWATAAFVLGAEAGRASLEEHPDLEGVLVEEDAEGRLVMHETSGFAAFMEERP